MAKHSATTQPVNTFSGLTTVLIVAPTSALFLAVIGLSIWTIVAPGFELALLALSGS